MNLMSKTLLGAGMALIGVSGSGALAQDASMASGTCKTPGAQYAFAAVPTDGRKPLPSDQKQIGALALLARQNGCNIELVCVRASDAPEERQKQRNQCVGVRDTLVRATRGARFGKDNIIVHRTKPSGGYKANVIYAILR